jgi:DNA end-binding protein Ku
VLNLLRWGGEIRSWEDLKLPPVDAKAAGVKESELNMAKQLIEGMTAHWSADAFRDSFKDEIMKLVEAKAQAGQTEEVTQVEKAPSGGDGNVIDLTELLRRSLRGGAAAPAARAPAPAPAKAPQSRKAGTAKTPAKPTAARKPAAGKPRASRTG